MEFELGKKLPASGPLHSPGFAPEAAGASADVLLWAIDPGAGADLIPNAGAIELLTRLSGRRSDRLQPVCVVGDSKTTATPPRRTLGQRSAAIEKEISRLLHTLGVETCGPTRVIGAHTHSIDDTVRCLVHHARTANARLIAVCPHAHPPRLHWLKGGFTDRLVAESPLPILFLSRRDQNDLRIVSIQTSSHALFVTDFSSHSQRAFHAFLGFAQQAELTVDLLYGAAIPLEATCDAGMLSAACCLPDEYFDEQRQWATQVGHEWREQAATRGMSCRLLIDNSGPNLAATILAAAARTHALLIAMASTYNPSASWFAGNALSEICRRGLFPTWIYGEAAGLDEAKTADNA